MDAQYQAMYKQAATLQHTFHDYTHANKTAYDPTATLIRNELHGLTNDLAAGKNPRTIDNRLKLIQNKIKETQRVNPMNSMNPMHSVNPMNPAAGLPGHSYGSPVLNYNQRNNLSKNFQGMRQAVQARPHF